MITSRHYRSELPAWVQAFNAERRPHATFGATWNRLLDAKIYDQVQGPDDAPGEGEGSGFTRTMPKTITGGKDTLTPAFFSAFDASPFSAEFLGAFVERAIREEKLGRHAATDLLCVSFSQIDAVGHMYGPDSHELMDSVLRLDRVLARLLDCLDREVGLARCVIVLTADHGVPSLPELVQGRSGADAGGRLKVSDMDTPLKKALDTAYGALPEGQSWFTRDFSGYHLRPPALASKKISASEAAKLCRDTIKKLPFIAAAYTRDELLKTAPAGSELPAMVRRSYRSEGDRDVVYILKPNFSFWLRPTGVTHGSPHPYDTHVAQLWFGAGIRPGVRTERVGVDDIAPTLAALLGVPAPNAGEGRRLF